MGGGWREVLSLLPTRAELATPTRDLPFGMLFSPFGGDLLALNHARCRAQNVDGRALLMADARHAG